MRGAFVVGGVLSLFWLPIFFSAIIAFSGAIFVPFLPVSLGVLADALYGVPRGIPLYTLAGAIVSLGAFFVRAQLKTSIIEQ